MIAWSVIAGLGLFMIAAMNAGWLFQRRAGNSGWIDVFWTYGTGAACAAAALWPQTGALDARGWLLAAMMASWALRLGSYIALRVARSAEDARYVRFKADWGAAYQRRIWILIQPQAAVSALLCLSVMAAAVRPAGALDLRDFLAVAIFLLAVGGETVADRQLAQFKVAHPKGGGICDVGLWRWSRHPNYFFEWLTWFSLPVMALDPARPVSWLTLAAPAVMFIVLRYVTGVPPLEAAMQASRGAAFDAYRRRTSAFFPVPPRPEGASS